MKIERVYGISEKRKILIESNKKFNIPVDAIKENLGLLLPRDFSWKDYVSLHQDLKNTNEVYAKIHYILVGNYEGRRYKKNIKNVKLREK